MSIRLNNTTTHALLQEHAKSLATTSLSHLVKTDKDRFSHFSREAAGILIDFSKQKINDKTLELLFSLAKEQELSAHFSDLFHGKFINQSENRLAWHPALRAPISERSEDVKKNIAHMSAIINALHTHSWRGFSGEAITDVVSLGIGGSYLGPAMATEALWRFQQPTANGNPLRVHFVANVHANALEKCLKTLNPATTLFLVSSKSFTTMETMTNFARAKKWMSTNTPDDFNKHFIAITAAPEKALTQQFNAENILYFPEWVGGRFSLWSTIGLPIALSIGMQQFEQLLAGAHAMDQHVLNAAPSDNLAIILALLDIWQIEFHRVNNHAILAYHHDLQWLPTYLQQLLMESNGKNRDRNGHLLDYHTSPIVWGGVGTLGQHAYHQLLHQGTTSSIIDFILVANETPHQLQKEMLSNALGHAIVLLEGDTQTPISHAILPGNKPSTTLWLETLTPYSLGSLLALYEHRTFAQAMLWHINPFDQWGVERGKMVEMTLHTKLENVGTSLSLTQLADLMFF